MASGSKTALLFHPSSSILSARIQPVVLFNICDSYVRRPDQAERVIGTLLGSVSADGIVEIKNSYAVPHNEFADQVALDIEYHHTMYASHQKVNPKEVIVGWYSTGAGVSGGSQLIHDFYSKEVSNPVHLTVDTGFTNGEASIKAYVSFNLFLGDRQLAAQFQEIPLDLRMIEAERVGFDILKMTTLEKLPNDLEGMEATMKRLLALIDDVYKYVDGVIEGRLIPDNNIGRFISDTLSSLPKISPTAFDKVFNDRIQDNYALVYLASLARTQLSIAEKLNTAAQHQSIGNPMTKEMKRYNQEGPGVEDQGIYQRDIKRPISRRSNDSLDQIAAEPSPSKPKTIRSRLLTLTQHSRMTESYRAMAYTYEIPKPSCNTLVKVGASM